LVYLGHGHVGLVVDGVLTPGDRQDCGSAVPSGDKWDVWGLSFAQGRLDGSYLSFGRLRFLNIGRGRLSFCGFN
jgi:hypothetical protein